MATPRVLILRAPGTNCDEETEFAFRLAGAEPHVKHLNELLGQPDQLKQYQILCIPGGFSFGDDIAAGRIFASQLLHRAIDVLQEFYQQGNLLLGICNGFQVLLKTGLLFHNSPSENLPATLTWNDNQRFEDRWVQLQTSGSKCVFLQGVESIYLPIAHAEGKFVAADPDTLSNWDSQGQLALRYCSPQNGNGANGNAANDEASSGDVLPFPINPNGSQRNVAGVCDDSGRVFGLMPHPERFVDPIQHPRWTREPQREVGDGLIMFQNAVRYFN